MSRDVALSALCDPPRRVCQRHAVSWNTLESLDNPSLSSSLSSPAISAVLHCGTGAASPPRFRGLSHRIDCISQLATDEIMPLELIRVEMRFGFFVCMSNIRILRTVYLIAVFWGSASSLSCLSRNPVGLLGLLFAVSPSLFETDHAHQGQTGTVQRWSCPHGQPETIFYLGCYKRAWLLSTSLGSEMKILDIVDCDHLLCQCENQGLAAQSSSSCLCYQLVVRCRRS